MADNVSQEERSRIMKQIRSKNTKLENSIASGLWKRGYRFRRNVKSLFGKPDIAIKKYHVVIFIDSCFWHGCPQHCRIPKSNRAYWENKINSNKKRDKEVSEYYIKKHWNLLRIWEHDIKDNYEKSLDLISKFIENAKKSASNSKT
jgi:DNA mismatch endonuclease (patch repair protein)